MSGLSSSVFRAAIALLVTIPASSAWAGTIISIDGDAAVFGVPGSVVGWGFSVTSDPGVFPLFTGSQFSPDPNSVGIYVDYLASSFFFGTGGGVVVDSFDQLTLSGAGEFDISSLTPLGSVVLGDLQLFWDEYSVSPDDPSFDPQADLINPGQSAFLAVSVTAGDSATPVVTPEPGTFWLGLPALVFLGWRIVKRALMRIAASGIATLAIVAALSPGVQAFQVGLAPTLTQPESDALGTLRYHNGINSILGACHPDSSPTDNLGCCGSPGAIGCFDAFGVGTATNSSSANYCTLPSSNNLHKDPYGTLIFCNLPNPSCDPSVSSSIMKLMTGPNPMAQNVTLFFTSDIHFYRGTNWLPQDQIRHISNMDNLNTTGSNPYDPGEFKWTYKGDLIGQPSGLVIGGDIGVNATPSNLGAFRLMYENNTGASLKYPVFFGLGNHETVTEATAADAHRMFDYVTNRMNCSGISQDPITGNYSWDWGRLHLVMLNTWADDTNSNYTLNTHPHGLTWLAQDLANSVGTTGRPVILFQHYGFTDFSFSTTMPWWTTDNATSFLNVIANYNIVGIFNGHTHQPSVQRLDTTDWSIDTNTKLTDTLGVAKAIDVFTNGTGGEQGTGDFIAIRYTDGLTPDSAPYLDVESMHWDNSPQMQQGISTVISNPEGQGSDYFGGRHACRKRISTRFNDISSLVQVSATSSVATNSMVATFMNARHAVFPSPLAVQVGWPQASSFSLSNADFMDSCGTSSSNPGTSPIAPGTPPPSNSYVLLNDAQVTALNAGSLQVTLSFGPTQILDPQGVCGIENGICVNLVALTPLRGATPTATSLSTVTTDSMDVVIPNSPVQPPALSTPLPLSTQSFTAYGRPQASYVLSVQYGPSTNGGPQSWATLVSPGSGQFDATGRTLVTFTIDPNQLKPVNNEVPSVTYTVNSSGDPFGFVATMLVTVHFKAASTIQITENPLSTYDPTLPTPPAKPALITALIQFTPFTIDGDNQKPTGVITLSDATLDMNRNVVSTAPVTFQIINSHADTDPCPSNVNVNGNNPSDNTVIFGDTGSGGQGFCPSFVTSNTPFVWTSLPLGLHHFVVQFSGDNAFAPVSSAVFDYLVVKTPTVIRVGSGGGQTALAGTPFSQPLQANVLASGVAQPGIPVTFTAPASGASGFFPGTVQSVTVLTDSSGNATTPVFNANIIGGSYSVQAAVPSLAPGLSASFGLMNAGVASAPLLTAIIASKTGALNARIWTVSVTNTQGAASNAAISSLTFTQVAGTSCAPVIQTPFPIVLGNIANGASAPAPVTIDFSSCASTARFTVGMGLQANAGSYQKTTTIGNQFP
jgi:hypothetical protein